MRLGRLERFAGREVELELTTATHSEFDPSLGVPVWANPEIVYPHRSGRLPNIILIVLDTLRADHLSCYGYERDTSPNIDRLAGDGHRFAESYSTSTWTLPSTATMLTGLLRMLAISSSAWRATGRSAGTASCSGLSVVWGLLEVFKQTEFGVMRCQGGAR